MQPQLHVLEHKFVTLTHVNAHAELQHHVLNHKYTQQLHVLADVQTHHHHKYHLEKRGIQLHAV